MQSQSKYEPEKKITKAIYSNSNALTVKHLLKQNESMDHLNHKWSKPEFSKSCFIREVHVCFHNGKTFAYYVPRLKNISAILVFNLKIWGHT